MPPGSKCAAISAAQQRTGLSDADVAAKIGSTPARVTEIISGAAVPTEAEFKALSVALDISDVPHSGVHQTA